MRKTSSLLLGFLLMTGAALAVPVDCTNFTTVGDATNLQNFPDGCIDQDKIYDLWSSTLPSGTGLDIATTPGPIDVHSVNLGPVGPQAGTQIYTLDYRISIDPSVSDYALRNIVEVTLDVDALPVTTTQVQKEYWSDGFDGTPAGVGSLISTGSVETDNTVFNKFLYVRDTITLLNNSTLQSTTNGFNQTAIPEVPEPSTYLLLGSGLVALGMLRRRTSRRQPRGES